MEETEPSIIDLRDDYVSDNVDIEDDIDVAADACIPNAVLKEEAKIYTYLAELYGKNVEMNPRQLTYGVEMHTLNSFHYRGSSRVRDVTSTRANAKKAYIDVNDTAEIIYRWEIMGCLTTQMKYKVLKITI